MSQAHNCLAKLIQQPDSTGGGGYDEENNNKDNLMAVAPNQVPPPPPAVANPMLPEMVNRPTNSFQAIKFAPIIIIKYRLVIECKQENNNHELKRGRGYDPELENLQSENNGNNASDLVHLDLYQKRDNHFIKRLLTANSSIKRRLPSNLSFNFDLKQTDLDSLDPSADIESELVIVVSFTDSHNNQLRQQPNITLEFLHPASANLNQLSRQSANDSTNKLSSDPGKLCCLRSMLSDQLVRLSAGYNLGGFLVN